MKKYFAIALLLPAFMSVAAPHRVDQERLIKSKIVKESFYKQHERDWQQPKHKPNVALYKCVDSGGHKIRGKFTSKQQYFIELGGGSCRNDIRHSKIKRGALNAISHYDFEMDNVYRAIRKIRRDYGVHHAPVVESLNVRQKHKNFKYTLVFKVGRHEFREFRVKHNRWNGQLKNIREV